MIKKKTKHRVSLKLKSYAFEGGHFLRKHLFFNLISPPTLGPALYMYINFLAIAVIQVVRVECLGAYLNLFFSAIYVNCSTYVVLMTTAGKTWPYLNC